MLICFMPALLKRVGLPVKYTDNAKLFISFINIGIVGCAFLLFLFCIALESSRSRSAYKLKAQK
ncbi:hypothetical protein GFK18_24920, partial [Salmonella enterica subsp. enterica serovar Enteritidis]|nr:hypothetical protein [Salmonella enterica subsp. enterica serovar Enteritidis]